MKLGFTGTRHGMTAMQRQAFTDYIKRERPVVFHHGGCIGADAQAHAIVRGVLRMACSIDVWPSNRVNGYQANIPDRPGVRFHLPKPPLLRNELIVDSTDMLFCAPATAEEVMRSGTWSAYRYAKMAGRLIILCVPTGEISEVRDV